MTFDRYDDITDDREVSLDYGRNLIKVATYQAAGEECRVLARHGVYFVIYDPAPQQTTDLVLYNSADKTACRIFLPEPGYRSLDRPRLWLLCDDADIYGLVIESGGPDARACLVLRFDQAISFYLGNGNIEIKYLLACDKALAYLNQQTLVQIDLRNGDLLREYFVPNDILWDVNVKVLGTLGPDTVLISVDNYADDREDDIWPKNADYDEDDEDELDYYDVYDDDEDDEEQFEYYFTLDLFTGKLPAFYQPTAQDQADTYYGMQLRPLQTTKTAYIVNDHYDYFRLLTVDFRPFIDTVLWDFAVRDDGELITISRQATHFRVYDYTGKFLRESRKYQLITFLDSDYFLAVDNDGYFKLFDYQENPQIIITKYHKKACTVSYRVYDDIFDITIYHGESKPDYLDRRSYHISDGEMFDRYVNDEGLGSDRLCR